MYTQLKRFNLRSSISRFASVSLDSESTVVNKVSRRIIPKAAQFPKKVLSHSSLKRSPSREEILTKVCASLMASNTKLLVANNAVEKSFFNDMGFQLEELKTDAEGVIPSSLDNAMNTIYHSKSPMIAFSNTATERPQYLYTQTSMMSAERCEELYNVASSHNLIIVESTNCNSAALRKMDQQGRVLKTFNAEELSNGLQRGLVGEAYNMRQAAKRRQEIDDSLKPQVFQNMFGFP